MLHRGLAVSRSLKRSGLDQAKKRRKADKSCRREGTDKWEPRQRLMASPSIDEMSYRQHSHVHALLLGLAAKVQSDFGPTAFPTEPSLNNPPSCLVGTPSNASSLAVWPLHRLWLPKLSPPQDTLCGQQGVMALDKAASHGVLLARVVFLG